jgi:hypothetical protein
VSQVRSGTVVLFVLSLPLLVGIFVYGPFILDLLLHRRPPSLFLIPAGYVGWVRIEYQISSAPPLPREGKHQLVRLDRNGSAQTSSHLPEGWAHDQYFYESGQGRRALSNAGWCKGGMIWGEAVGKDQGSATSQTFFVGSEDQFRMEVDPAGRTYSPCG